MATFSEKEKQFIIYSFKERAYFKDFWVKQKRDNQQFEITNISKSEDKKKWDAIIRSGGTRNICEFKIRDYKIDSFKGCFIEKHKYDYLTSAAKTSNDHPDAEELWKPWYIAFYPKSNKLAIWDLSTITITEWRSKFAKSHNVIDSQKKIQYDYDLSFTLATIYDIPNTGKDYQQLAIDIAEIMFRNNEFRINSMAE